MKLQVSYQLAQQEPGAALGRCGQLGRLSRVGNDWALKEKETGMDGGGTARERNVNCERQRVIWQGAGQKDERCWALPLPPLPSSTFSSFFYPGPSVIHWTPLCVLAKALPPGRTYACPRSTASLVEHLRIGNGPQQSSSVCLLVPSFLPSSLSPDSSYDRRHGNLSSFNFGCPAASPHA